MRIIFHSFSLCSGCARVFLKHEILTSQLWRMPQISALIRIHIPHTGFLMQDRQQIVISVSVRSGHHRRCQKKSSARAWTHVSKSARVSADNPKSLRSIELLISRKINQSLLQMRLVFCGGGSTGDIGAQVPGGLRFSEPAPGECQ